MVYDLFHRAGPGRFYRGNLHTHSTMSDGGMTPEAVCRAYRQQGYDFLAVTDHYIEEWGYPITDTTPYRTDDFTTLIGSELHAPALANGSTWHMVAAGLPLDFGGLRDGETGAQLAERAAQAGAFVGLAHPAWYGASIDDLQSIPAAHAIEAYNQVCAGLSDRAESWFHADALLCAGRRVSAYGADDAHFRTEMPKGWEDREDMNTLGDDFLRMIQETAADPIAAESGEDVSAGFGAWVWVRAERLDPLLLVEALKTSDYYTSQGPQIHDITVDPVTCKISIVCTPASSIFLTGRPEIISGTYRHGTRLTHTTFSYKSYRDSYCRVTVVDAAGKRAWSNPIWFD